MQLLTWFFLWIFGQKSLKSTKKPSKWFVVSEDKTIYIYEQITKNAYHLLGRQADTGSRIHCIQKILLKIKNHSILE
jgi:hypothetical protein